MVDHSQMRLGKQAPRHDPRTLLMAKYTTAQLPAPPEAQDWGDTVTSWPMFDNDKIGDCTIAAAGHMLEVWSSEAQHAELVLADGDILKAYEDVSGYEPNSGRNDTGAAELDVLNYWRQQGIGKQKISGFVAVEPKNRLHIMQAIYLFGGCYIGLALPVTAQSQEVWAVPPGGATGSGAPGSWGGHAVNVVAYDSDGLTVITWGAKKRMTWTFWDTYCDEAYGIVTQLFIDRSTHKAPVGFRFTQLMNDLTAL